MSLSQTKRRKLSKDELEIWNEYEESGGDPWIIDQTNPATGNTFREDWWGEGLLADVDPSTGKVTWSPYKQMLDEEVSRKARADGNWTKEWQPIDPVQQRNINHAAGCIAAPMAFVFIVPGLAMVILGLWVIVSAFIP